jgi:hypothetical protein
MMLVARGAAALEIEKGELMALVKSFYFTHHAGQMAVA